MHLLDGTVPHTQRRHEFVNNLIVSLGVGECRVPGTTVLDVCSGKTPKLSTANGDRFRWSRGTLTSEPVHI